MRDANEANTAAVAAARVLNHSASEVTANRIITHEQRKRFQAALGNEAGYFQVRSCLRTGS